MSVKIHPQAIVSNKACLSSGVEVGPFSIVEDNVKIGENTKIGSNCLVTGFTTIGKNSTVFNGAVLGSPPQDLKYKDQKSYTEIGDSNIIREFVTVNPGTEDNTKTIIGNGNLIMAYSHIAHNCKVGNECVLANAATLAGYVDIEDKAVIGGLVAVHQFCRVGKLSIVGGCSKVVQDIPPYSMADGHPAKVKGLNLIGLRRARFSKDDIHLIKRAFKILFFEEHTLNLASDIVKKELPSTPPIDYLLKFVKSSSRGMAK